MPLSERKIKTILKKYRELFETLARYDETREWPIGRKRIDITIDKRLLKKLDEIMNKI